MRSQQHDGVVVEMVECSRGQGFAKPHARDREEEQGVVRLGLEGTSLVSHPSPLYRWRGKGVRPNPS